MYAAIKDLFLLRNFKSFVEKKCRLVEKNKIELRPIEQESCDKITNNFEGFAMVFTERISRYTYLFLGLAVLVAFEDWIGKKTLSEPGLLWTAIGYFLLAGAFVLISCGFYYYEDAFRKSEHLLYKVDCYNRHKFDTEYNVVKFVGKIFRSHLALDVAVIILTLTIIRLLFISS